MGKVSERVIFGLAGAMAGVTALTASAGGCGAAGCQSCFGCAGAGLLLAAAAVGKRLKGVRHGRNATSDTLA